MEAIEKFCLQKSVARVACCRARISMKTIARFLALVAALQVPMPIPAAGQSYPPAFPRQNATKLVETDRIVVWDIVWPKGQPSPLHRHVYDQVGTYYQTGGRAITPISGPTSKSTTPVGNISTTRKGTTHVEEGTTEPPLRAIFIELKSDTPSTQGTDQTSLAPRAGAKQVHTEDRVTAWDYTWSPGVTPVKSRYERETVIVWLTPGSLRLIEGGGAAKVVTVQPGTMWHREKGAVVTEELVSGSPREIIFEFK